MIFIGRKNIKLFKLFLVSPLLEKLLLICFILFLPLIAFYPANLSTYTDLDLAINLMNSFDSTIFSSILTKESFYQWSNSSVIETYYTTKITPNMPLRSIRLRQYRYPCDLNDLSYNCLQLIQNLIEIPKTYNFNLTNNCVYQSCEEFQYRYDKKTNDYVKGTYGLYPMFGYRVELGYDKITASKNLLKLEENSWVDNRTVALLLEANYYNYWRNKYVIVRCLLEFQGGEVRERTFTYAFVGAYNDENVIMFILLVFLIQFALYLFKIMFEMTLICNRILFFGQISHLAVQFAFIILFSIKLTFLNQAKPEVRAMSNSAFIYLYDLVILDNYCKFMLFLTFLFYPFKIFQLISWSKYMNFLVKFWIAIYRTLPGISLFFLMVSIVTLTWSLGFMVIFQDFLLEFKDYGASMLSLFSINFTGVGFTELGLLIGTYNEIYFFIHFIQCFSFFFILVYFFALLSDLFHRSALLEFSHPSPNEKETQEKLEEMQSKFDRFIKELKKEFDKDKKDSDDNIYSHNQNKILIWLDCSQGVSTVYEDVMNELKDLKVQTRRFIHKEEVLQFLDYLFKLKPNLLSFRAG